MRILICTDSFYPGIGGTEAACLGFANELKRQGHEVMLACPKYPIKDERKYDFEVVRLASISLTKNDKMVLLGLSQKSIKTMIDFKPDIIQVESISGMAKIALKIGKKLNIPVIMTIHTQFKTAFYRYIKSKLIVNCILKNAANKLKKADAVLTVVDCIKKDIDEWGYHGEVQVIRNGAMFEKKYFTDEDKNNFRKELNFDSNDNILIFVGRIFKFKNIEFIIKSLKKSIDLGFNGKLIIVGNGMDIDYFKNLVKNLGIENNVIFTGEIKDRQLVAKYYALSDIFITASKFDTDPIVVVEGACMGLPSLVLENTGCSTRVIDGETGFSAPEDEELFAKKIINIFADRDNLNKISKNAREKVPSTWEDTVKSNLEVYKRVIDSRRT